MNRDLIHLAKRLISTSSSSQSQQSSSRRTALQLDALTFSVSPSDAYTKFERWANNDQGLGSLLKFGGSTTISAAYTPFWYFGINIRFVPPALGKASYVVPEPFRSAYPNPPGGVIHLPGVASYAGFTYRRSLVDPVHNTTPVFLRQSILPFRKTFLDQPLVYNGKQLDIFPDPWNATRERAYTIIRDELHSMANEQYRNRTGSTTGEVKVEMERLSARRIYMPTYIVDYTVLGITYRAIISGCDSKMPISGLSHRTLFEIESESKRVVDGASSFLSFTTNKVAPVAASAYQFFGPRPFVALAQALWVVISRILMRIPLISVLGGAFVAYRKLVRPYVDDRSATAEWERKRDHESRNDSSSASSNIDILRDDGSARAYFTANETRILNVLSGEQQANQREGTEWYKQWEAWAKEQWDNAQREANRAQEEFQRQQQQQQQQGSANNNRYQQSQRQQQGRRQYKQATKDDDYKWDFDINDPWSVLGIPRKSSKEEVSKAFRREMLKHHPDLQLQNSDSEKRRANERSKILSDAYRKIKAGYAKK